MAVASPRPASSTRWLGALAVFAVSALVIILTVAFFGVSWAIILATFMAIVGLVGVAWRTKTAQR